MASARALRAVAITCAAVTSLAGCDSAHEAIVQIRAAPINSALAIRGSASGDAVVGAFKDVAQELNYPCYPPRKFATDVARMSEADMKQFGYPEKDALMICGPAWFRTLTLYKKTYGYQVVFSQANPGWGVPPYFCETKKRVFSYFSERFPEETLKLTLNPKDACRGN